MFIAAQIVHGVGFTPMFTLGTAYIDENEEHSLAAVYIGKLRIKHEISRVMLKYAKWTKHEIIKLKIMYSLPSFLALT